MQNVTDVILILLYLILNAYLFAKDMPSHNSFLKNLNEEFRLHRYLQFFKFSWLHLTETPSIGIENNAFLVMP